MAELTTFALVCLSVVFLAAAAGKARDLERFRVALRSHRWIPVRAHRAISIGVPAAEAGCIALTIVPPTRVVGAAATLLLLAAFQFVLIRSLVRGDGADCGCFGSAGAEKVSWFSVARNVVLMGLAGAVALHPAAEWVVPAALTGAAVALLLLVVDQAIAVFREYWINPDQLEG